MVPCSRPVARWGRAPGPGPGAATLHVIFGTRAPPTEAGPGPVRSPNNEVQDNFRISKKPMKKPQSMLNVSAARIETMTRTCNLAVPRPYGAPHMTIESISEIAGTRGRARIRVLRTVWALDCKRRHTRRARSRTRCATRNDHAVYDHVRGRSLDPRTRGPQFPSERADEMLDAGPTVERHEDALSFAQVNVEDWLE